jgi:hypothetical protein
MAKDIEEATANWGRAVHSELIAVLETLMERGPAENRTPELEASVNELYGLVSSSGSHELMSKSKAILKQVAPTNFKQAYPYAEALFSGAIKLLKKEDELEGYIENYANSLVLDLSHHHITKLEVETVKHNIVSIELFADQLMAYYNTATDEARKDIEESCGLDREKLEKKIYVGDLNIRELAIINLVLELKTDFKVIDAATGEVMPGPQKRTRRKP